ncbi:hypothetical protein AVJ23_11365 [Pseudoponticoccus marisrubri]|uniref:CENP-V/GFA domain-containing protein n=2 Tax=Pseudoponticoccus marisrubri TaxID=1685382 RepID=A0A0W7WIU8_9RHOB|nr:hypothetical protein AVJ23_11365 [Pseudoponticoccus marisrubri]
MCGAVRFTARDVPATCGVCHCEMCRRWTGSALIEVSVPTENVTWEDETYLGRFASSHWAERGFCTRCGTGLFFRVTMEGEWFGSTELPIGVFDDPNGFEIAHQIFIDHKPDSFAYSGQETHTLLTRAECVAKFSVLDEDAPVG